ncbi:MAG: hypothetical protein K9G67_12960 [Bacteroidales bacterium]|nr:hypothetical protein [Bacteroidales bacterium]MCF8377261.1 hypothetical protein [Bacteroidales bacterium]MCF8401117.1 hypothetical protein [Bacteroidales bacterium]
MKTTDLNRLMLSCFLRKTAMLCIMLLLPTIMVAQVSVNSDGSSPDASSMLEVKATGKGFLPPRMTLTNRPSSPAIGLLYYQTDNTSGFYYYNGNWKRFGDYWQSSGSDIYFSAGQVAIGTNDPLSHGLNAVNYTDGKAAVRGSDQWGDDSYATGFLGVLKPSYLGAPISVWNAAVLGIKPNVGLDGAAIYGWNNDDNSTNYAGLFVADGANTGTNYAIYAKATNGNYNLAGDFSGRVRVVGHSHSTAEDYTNTVLSSTVNHTLSSDTRAIEGTSTPANGYGYGVYGTGSYMGVRGFNNSNDYASTSYGVYGSSTGTSGTRVGVYGYTYGSASTCYGIYGYSTGTGTYSYGVRGAASGSAGTNIGVYGYASSGTTNWAGYFLGDAYVSSDLRVGTTTQATGYSVSVDGKIACEEVLVEDMASWPDYVFSDEYILMSLEEVEEQISQQKHLPGIPSAQEIEENGLLLGDMQKKLLEKVEELTLHLIQQNKKIADLEAEINKIKKDNE